MRQQLRHHRDTERDTERAGGGQDECRNGDKSHDALANFARLMGLCCGGCSTT